MCFVLVGVAVLGLGFVGRWRGVVWCHFCAFCWR